MSGTWRLVVVVLAASAVGGFLKGFGGEALNDLRAWWRRTR